MPSETRILNAARIDGSGIYFLGPYGKRVNFTGQQRRALNLVSALHSSGALDKYPKVGIIGAGIGGVMAAAALRACGCVAQLIEANGAALEFQARATHRFVHPTLGFWPYEITKITTKLPYFDWYSATCDEILSVLKAEWTHRIEPKLPPPMYNQTVTSVMWDSVRERAIVKLKRQSHPKNFDLVIVATGFGQDVNSKDDKQHSYWRSDDIDEYAIKVDQEIYVSGTGDGGLIDLFRIIHCDFEHGKLCTKLLRAIDSEAIRHRVREIEDHAQAIWRRKGLRPNIFERLALHYHRKYNDILPLLSVEALALLEGSLRSKNYTTLIGLYNYPFEYSVAPIHKIMLAHAFSRNGMNSKDAKGRPYLSFVTGMLTRIGRGYYLKQGTAPAVRLRGNLFVVRHGPISKRPPVHQKRCQIDRINWAPG